MLTVRHAAQRGHTDLGWLDSRHTFSFGRYHDPAWMGFGPLRVINDDRVVPGKGFGEHPHRDMEIISYVVEGALAHRDSTGQARQIGPGGVQRMTAGRGVSHSEFNPSSREPVRFIQVWIEPEAKGLPASYEDREAGPAAAPNRLRLLAARQPDAGAVTIHQDVKVYAGVFGPGEGAALPLAAGRRAWVQVIRGSVMVNGVALAEGDGAALTDEAAVDLRAGTTMAEVLVFDLP